jgi:hypothetical protein
MENPSKTTAQSFIPLSIPLCVRWLFPYKPKPLPIPIHNAFSYYLLQNKITLTLINWLFQGMRGMGRVDLIGKVVLEIVFFGIAFFFVNGSLGFRAFVAFLIAHTLNWFLNTHFWVTGRFLGITRTRLRRFAPYIKQLMLRLHRCSALDGVIIIGGVSREEGIKTTSDVDIFFIRKKGLINAIVAAAVTIKERSHAFVSKFPLHLEFYDDISMMDRHRKDEVPYILKDSSGIAGAYYQKQHRKTAQFEDYEKEAQGSSS